ncbi:MAG TPA: hypothetical protein VGJ48_27575 [Pyrinomonadaceae bacterium]|jgi:hypothetical protein
MKLLTLLLVILAASGAFARRSFSDRAPSDVAVIECDWFKDSAHVAAGFVFKQKTKRIGMIPNTSQYVAALNGRTHIPKDARRGSSPRPTER